ncbi:hypothetical protein ACS0TY_018280 [Phlomoides rotata]
MRCRLFLPDRRRSSSLPPPLSGSRRTSAGLGTSDYYCPECKARFNFELSHSKTVQS